jgi:hypothetical protein
VHQHCLKGKSFGLNAPSLQYHGGGCNNKKYKQMKIENAGRGTINPNMVCSFRITSDSG